LAEPEHMYFREPVQFQRISSATIAYRKFGKGQPLIFLHGWPLAGVTFRKMIPSLHDHFTCYVPDLPGGGETHWYSDTYFTWPGQARSVKEFMNALGLKNYFLLGQDSGAMIARQLALIDGQRILKFAMTNTEIPGHRPDWIPFYRQLMFFPRIANPLFRLCLRSRWFLRSPCGLGGSFSDLNLIAGDFSRHIVQPLVASPRRMEGHIHFLRGWDWKLLDTMKQEHGKISMPVLLIWGEDDPTFPLKEAEKMAQQFPNCRVCAIPRAKLFVQEEQPEKVSKILLEFLK
jgi:haloalkane dehalogenase